MHEKGRTGSAQGDYRALQGNEFQRYQPGHVRKYLRSVRRPDADLAVCDAYRDAVSHLPPAQIEALDQERKRAHNEASALIADRLTPAIEMDEATARRLFTLISALGNELGGR